MCAFAVYMLLWFLRLFNVVGSEADILIRWVSTVSLILLGVFIGIAISERRIRVRGMLASLLLVAVGFVTTPVCAGMFATLVSKFPFDRRMGLIVVGVATVSYFGLYMAFLFWLKKKGVLHLGE